MLKTTMPLETEKTRQYEPNPAMKGWRLRAIINVVGFALLMFLLGYF